MNLPQDRPTLHTPRLILRPFALADAADVQRRLAGDRAIAANTQNMPHPYEDGMAEAWIAGHPEKFAMGEGLTLAVTLREGGLLGAISLMDISDVHERAEIGYWIGRPWWGNGYCTEAARAMIGYGFEVLGLNRIQARHFSRNPASGAVMQKCGMRHEGRMRQCVKRWGVFEDDEFYGILRSEYKPA